MRRRNLAVFTAATVMAAVIVPINSAEAFFTDVSTTNSHYEAIQSLVERGVIHGYEDGTYRPNEPLTRGQAAKILALALDLDASSKDQRFTDVSPSSAYAWAIHALDNAGIINGYEDGTFRPNQPLTRGQMAKIIVNAFNLEEASVVNLPFEDVTAQNGYKHYIQSLLNYGITRGTTSTTFSPTSSVNRGQMASFVVRAENANLISNKEIVTKTIKSKIEAVENGKLILAEGTFELDDSLLAIFNTHNAEALEQAVITAVVDNGVIIDVTALTITALGTSDKPVFFGGKNVTSEDNTQPKANFAGIVTVASNNIELLDIQFTNEVILTDSVKQLTYNKFIRKLTINKDVEAVIHGISNVEQINIASEKPIQLNIAGTIKTLSFVLPSAAVQLGINTKITNMITPNATSAELFITNYQAVKANIGQINGIKPIVNSGGGGSTSTTDPIITKPVFTKVTGKFSATDGQTVVIDNNTYKIADKLQPFFTSNPKSLIEANLTVSLTSGVITAVDEITLNKSNQVLNGNGIVIQNLVVNNDAIKLKNMTITSNITITKNVNTSIHFDQVNVIGKVKILPQETAIRNRVLETVDTVTQVNASPILHVLSEDVTFSHIEIDRENTELGVFRNSKVAEIIVMENSSIVSEVILPKVIIIKNVTILELNAKIQLIEIESDHPLLISGKGNFGQVLSKNYKEVMLDVIGTIKQLSSEQHTFTLGLDVKVGKTSRNNGDEIPGWYIITNYFGIKDNVNVEIDEEKQFIVAKLTPVEGKYGYVTMTVLNSDDGVIKYRHISSDAIRQTAKIGDKVPSDTITYNEGDQFIAWAYYIIEVYKVDNENNITDVYIIPDGYSGVNALNVNLEDNILSIETILKPFDLNKTNLENLYLSFGSQVYALSEGELPNWTTNENEIRNVLIVLPSSIVPNSEDLNRIFIGLKEFYTQVEINPNYSQKPRDTANLSIINDLIHLLDKNRHFTYNVFDSALRDISWSYDSAKQEYVSYYKWFTANQNAYIEKLKSNSYNSGNEVRAMMDAVNNKLEYIENAYYIASQKVEKLFIEKYYYYPEGEQLAPTTTAETIADAKAAVEAIPKELEIEKMVLHNRIIYAEQLYKRFVTNPLDLTKLVEAIERANKLDKSQYSTISWNNLQSFVKYGEYLMKNIYSTQQEVDQCAKDLTDFMNNMKSVSNTVNYTHEIMSTETYDARLHLYNIFYTNEERQGDIVTINNKEHVFFDENMFREVLQKEGYQIQDILDNDGKFAWKFYISKANADVTTADVFTIVEGAIEEAQEPTINGHKQLIYTFDKLLGQINASLIKIGPDEPKTYVSSEELIVDLREYYKVEEIEEHGRTITIRGNNVTKEDISVKGYQSGVHYEEAGYAVKVTLTFTENVQFATSYTNYLVVDGKVNYDFRWGIEFIGNNMDLVLYINSSDYESASEITFYTNAILDIDGQEVIIENLKIK